MRGSRESLRSSRESLRGSQDSLHLLHPPQAPPAARGPLGLSALASRSWESLRGDRGALKGAPATPSTSSSSWFWNPLRRLSSGRNSLSGSSTSLQLRGGSEASGGGAAEKAEMNGGAEKPSEAEEVDSTM